jgi:hypothetical protein
MYLTHFLLISLASLLTIYPTPSSQHTSPRISPSTRAHWIRHANAALPSLSSSCPFMAFSTAIVNHSDTSLSPLGQLICLGVNDVLDSGNPTLHGEVAAINNCTEILRRREGWKGEDVGKAWRELSLYTNGEPCPMVRFLFLLLKPLYFSQLFISFKMSMILTMINTVHDSNSLGRFQGDDL